MIQDEMIAAALRNFHSENGKKGSEAKKKKYTKEERGEQIKRGLKRKKRAKLSTA